MCLLTGTAKLPDATTINGKCARTGSGNRTVPVSKTYRHSHVIVVLLLRSREITLAATSIAHTSRDNMAQAARCRGRQTCVARWGGDDEPLLSCVVGKTPYQAEISLVK
jgi:hypothetical protein